MKVLLLQLVLCSALLHTALSDYRCIETSSGTLFNVHYISQASLECLQKYKVPIDAKTRCECAAAVEALGHERFIYTDEGECYAVTVSSELVHASDTGSVPLYKTDSASNSRHIGRCPPGYSWDSRKWCFNINYTEISYPEAKESCEVTGGYLLSPRSSQELKEMNDYLTTVVDNWFWAGAEKVNGVWQWIHDKRPVEDKEWDAEAGLPDSQYDCANYDPEYKGRIGNDGECDFDMLPFICQTFRPSGPGGGGGHGHPVC